MDTTSTMRILIIDDDDVDRMTISRILKKSFPETLYLMEATSCEAALKVLSESDFDCVFLDYLLPDGDGFQLLVTVREKGITAPIVMLTGHGDESLAIKIMQAGAADYLPKNGLTSDNIIHVLHRARRLREVDTERVRAETDLRLSHKRIGDILESISDAFFAIDTQTNITYFNQRAEKILDVARDIVLNRTLSDAIPQLPKWFNDAVVNAMNNNRQISVEGQIENGNAWWEVQVYPGIGNVSVYFRDITEKKRSEQRLTQLANFDTLTSLPNRSLLMDRISQALARAPWRKRCVAVLFCDLDRFKNVNDTLGHDAGDELLMITSTRIKSCIRDGDTVARLGGDEFIVLLNDLANPLDAENVATKILAMLAQPIVLGSEEIVITSSIGIAYYPEHGDNAIELLKKADIAMYQAKKHGKNRYQIYLSGENKETAGVLSLESAMRRALENEEFEVHYQPIIDTSTGKIVAAEALVRWNHPTKGLIPPGHFLPVAEESGLIIELGNWVLRQSLLDFRSWQPSVHAPQRMAVNVSHAQFREQAFVNHIESTLNSLGVNPNCLEIELTESIAMHEISHTMSTLKNIRDLGASLAIDDFGTGYTSLSYLRKLPIQTLKVDRSFVQDIISDNDDKTIVEAIVALAAKLDLNIVAEGVESAELIGVLQKLGCNIMQGYYFSVPIPASKFTIYLNGLFSNQ